MRKFWHETRLQKKAWNGLFGFLLVSLSIVFVMFSIMVLGVKAKDESREENKSNSSIEEDTVGNEQFQNICGIKDNQEINTKITYSEETKETRIVDNTKVRYGDGNVYVYIGHGTYGDNSGYGLQLGSVENVLTACLTEEEAERVKNGEDAYIEICILELPSLEGRDAYVQIEDSLSNFYGSTRDLSMGLVIDIAMQKRVGEGDWISVNKMEAPLYITMDIPSVLQNPDFKFYMIRNHDGVCTLLENCGDEENRITFKTTLFSSFAMVYHQRPFTVRLFINRFCVWHIVTLVITIVMSGVLMLFAKTKKKVLACTVLCVGLDVVFALIGSCNLDYLMSFVASFIMVGLAVFQMERIYFEERKNKKEG